MAGPAQYEHPEPVPTVSQLCALPFVAAVAGYLTDTVGCGSKATRVTLHRVMTRDHEAYLQQVCSYAGAEFDHSKAGRLFNSTEGIIGKAFSERVIIRTRHLKDEKEWWLRYKEDRAAVSDTSGEVDQVLSYLAVPLLSSDAKLTVCVLYVEAGGLNVFTTNDQTTTAIRPTTALDTVLGMCGGYCRTLDNLAVRPLTRLRNYPLPAGKPVSGHVTAYPHLQEAISEPKPPRFDTLTSFNFAPTT
ncbi:hypothetical protein [Muricoccus pecuniae]|uniref:GAF domain-containing protein n=1 Tax=Muricoccus pecuniae TaxID=693023 RepID=A0A840YHS5_9PROT|nr:hypothetical protein [Roseomonas pecuniae]MBB5693533.1 hypothetical protein [Roseomonas pecuniae]